MTAWLASLVHTIVGLAGSNPWLVAAIVFAAAFSEAIVVVGALVPGTALILALAAAAGAGGHPVWPIVTAAALGAVASDGVSFWFGHRYRSHIAERWPFTRHPELLARGDAFFERHGGKSVLLARFLPGVRAVVPVSAGMAGMPVDRFYAANVSSAVIWAASHVLPGAFLGVALGVLGAASGRALVVLAALLLTVYVAVRFVRFVWSRLVMTLERLREVLIETARHRGDPLSRAAAAMLEPDRPDARVSALLVLSLGAVVTGFVALVDAVVARGEIARADHAIGNLALSLRNDWADAVFQTISAFGDVAVIVSVIAAVLVWLLWRGERRLAVTFAGIVAVTAIFVPTLKATVGIPRPFPMYSGAEAFSFPSGHATWSALVYGFVGWLASRDRTGSRAPVPLAVAGALIASIALARVYLGAHWPSDVLTGLSFGFGAVLVVAIQFSRGTFSAVDPARFGIVLAAVAIVAGGMNAAMTWTTAEARYAREPTVRTVSVERWLTDEWRTLPARRTDLGGDSEEPFTVQWAGTPTALTATLERDGWHRPQPWSLRTVADAFRLSTPLSTIPVTPELSDGRAATLELVRSDGADERLVARFWPTGLRVGTETTSVPVLEGTISRERRIHLFGLPIWPIAMSTPLPPAVSLPDAIRVTGTAGETILLAREAPPAP